MLADVSLFTNRNQRGTVWKTAQELDLSDSDTPVWNSYIKPLRDNFIHLGEEKDFLKWTWNTRDGKFSAKMGYEASLQQDDQDSDC